MLHQVGAADMEAVKNVKSYMVMITLDQLSESVPHLLGDCLGHGRLAERWECEQLARALFKKVIVWSKYNNTKILTVNMNTHLLLNIPSYCRDVIDRSCILTAPQF